MEESDFSCANLERGVTIASVLSSANPNSLTTARPVCSAVGIGKGLEELAGDGENYKIENERSSEVGLVRLKTPTPLTEFATAGQTDNTPSLSSVARSVMNNFYGVICNTETCPCSGPSRA